MLIEEFTGTWCQFCPQGIVTMDKLRETYTDGSVIPVAVHSGDEMKATSFSEIDRNYSDGYPSAIMNRMVYIEYIYPTEYCIEEIDAFRALPTPSKVTATAHFNETRKGVIFNTKTSFCFDNANAADEYMLSFAITEDNVGPYKQNSTFGSQPAGTLPGWDNGKPSSIETIYNDVARQINNVTTGSIPKSVEAGKEYEYTYELKFKAATKISNVENLNAIVYLINRKTNVVENAYMIKSEDLLSSGIEEIEATDNTNAPVEYFNLQGMRVKEPANGLYIRRQGSDTRKVFVK